MEQEFWEKRGLLREWVQELKTRNEWTIAQVAKAMGLAPLSLKKYLSKSATHKPGPDALRALGNLLGRDYRVLLDEPGVAPAGISEEVWSEASELDRVLASAMLEDLKLMTTKEEKEAHYQLWKQGIAIGHAHSGGKAEKASGAKGVKKP